MTFPIRTATADDADGVAHCVKRAYSHYIERIGKPPGPMLDNYTEVIQQHSVFVIDSPIDNQASIVGVLVLIQTADGLLLDNVAVDPAMQGAGIGQQLLNLAESEAGRRGFQHIELYTHERMTENIPYYEKRGYSAFERKTVKGYQRIYMRKQLHPPEH